MSPSTDLPRGRHGGHLSPVAITGNRKGRTAPNKGMKLPTETYTWAETEALIAACSKRGSCGLRDRAMLTLMRQTAARVNECLMAAERDVNLDELDFYVRFPKRDRNGVGRPRHLPLNVQTAAVIEQWATRRRKLLAEQGFTAQQARHMPFFCVVDSRSRGQKQHGSVWRDNLSRLRTKAGIDKRVHSHGFRKTAAIDMHIREGAPLSVVQEIMGHKDLSTTAIYLRGPAAQAAAQKFGRARAWPGDAPPAAAPDLGAALAAAIESNPQLAAAVMTALGHDDAQP